MFFFFALCVIAVHDSSAKISSGILNGNINYFGDFDQCLSIKGPADDENGDFTGKYCLAYLQTNITSSKHLPKHKYLHSLIQSHGAFQSDFNDVSII